MQTTLSNSNKIPNDIFRCPESGEKLTLQGDSLVSPSGKKWPIVNGIPRFVSSDHYVGSFSLEWQIHDTTQLDSHTGSTSSERILFEKTGLTKEQVEGKLILDAGVGAGRFTDVLAKWGANIVGVDLSYAVESSYQNLNDKDNVLIAQADIGKLPLAHETFDYIISIGVLHHTPNTRQYFEKLIPYLKPGGEICIWVYPAQGDYVKRVAWLPFVNVIPQKMFYSWCKVFVPYAQKHMHYQWIKYVAMAFPFSNQGLGLENDILDTFDAYSPTYHGIHNPPEILAWFEEAGLQNIKQQDLWDTAVRGMKPILDESL